MDIVEELFLSGTKFYSSVHFAMALAVQANVLEVQIQCLALLANPPLTVGILELNFVASFLEQMFFSTFPTIMKFCRQGPGRALHV